MIDKNEFTQLINQIHQDTIEILHGKEADRVVVKRFLNDIRHIGKIREEFNQMKREKEAVIRKIKRHHNSMDRVCSLLTTKVLPLLPIQEKEK